jgi:hypothetical protein
MYSNQQPPLYTTRHYIHDPQSNSTNYNTQSRSSGQPYPYYANNQQPTSVNYINDRSNYGQQQSSSSPYVPPNVNRYPATNTNVRSSNSGPVGGGGIEKTNMMSSENPFIDPARPYEQYHSPRIVPSITAQPKSGGSVNKSLNLSDENPFHTVYGGYHYPSQIDPTKRITTQNVAKLSTDNKSLNLSDDNPFFSTYGRYHYPSQIDPSKRITEMPKAAGSLIPSNEMSGDNPFNNYQPSTLRDYSRGTGSNSYTPRDNDWNRNNNNNNSSSAPLSYRSVQAQNNYNQPPPAASFRPPPAASSFRPPSPPSNSPPPARVQQQRPNPSGPLDKTSLNMSPDNPFAQTYGQYYYPSGEEIKAQKRAGERNTRFADQQPVNNNNNNNNNRPVQPTKQMSEFPETENKEVMTGKGNTKFTRFDVNF